MRLGFCYGAVGLGYVSVELVKVVSGAVYGGLHNGKKRLVVVGLSVGLGESCCAAV